MSTCPINAVVPPLAGYRGCAPKDFPEGPGCEVHGPPQSSLIPADRLSEREEWALRLATHGVMVAAEKRELMDFLRYPEQMPRAAHGDLAMAVVFRILEARARGEHIA